MHDAQQLPPAKIDRKVLSFCERLCPGQKPFYVPVQAEPWARPMESLANVGEQVRRSGGTLVTGWEISELPGIHLEAVFYAVWQSPQGAFLGVTPEETSRLLFVKDTQHPDTGVVPPNERFALGDKALVEKYWALTDRLRERLEALQLGGFSQGHPAMRQEITPLLAEIRALEEKLQKAG
ncbi:MAG TPA: hypothetical protein VNZ22_12575 [Bacillota bacterium]|nr:hypothetical protein [Bacillota bacterium]